MGLSKRYRAYEGQLVGLAFCVLIVACCLMMALWRVHSFGFVSVRQSVSETVRAGDVAITKPVDLRVLRPGDLVSYYDPFDLRTMRTGRVGAVQVSANTFTVETSVMSAGLLVGRVEYRLQHAAFLLDGLRSRLGLAVLIYIPALIIVEHELQLLAASYDRKIYRLFITQPGRL